MGTKYALTPYPIARKGKEAIVVIENLQEAHEGLQNMAKVSPVDCALCHGTGWIIEAKDKAGWVTLEIIPCLIPDCKKSGQKIKLMSVNEMYFKRVAMEPIHQYIMSLSS